MVRYKSRYLLCELCVSDKNSLQLLDDRAVFTGVRGAVCRAHGDYGAALCSVSFAVKYLNANTGVVFLRCRKSHYRILWSALPFITHLENRGQKVPCVFNCLYVGGTIRTCQKFLIRYNVQQLHRMLRHCHNEVLIIFEITDLDLYQEEFESLDSLNTKLNKNSRLCGSAAERLEVRRAVLSCTLKSLEKEEEEDGYRDEEEEEWGRS